MMKHLVDSNTQLIVSGHLIELTDTDKLTKLQKYLLTKFTNKTFWVGASDLEDVGTFRWVKSLLQILLIMIYSGGFTPELS